VSRQYVVIGLGRVGASLVRSLDAMGHVVLGIDHDEDIVQDLSQEVPNANLIASDDVAEPHLLRDLGVGDFDGAAVMIGENVEASVLVTLVLKDLGVPEILARANGPLHARVLNRIGADHVVQPEQEFGEFLAHRLSAPGIQDYLHIGEEEALVRMIVPDDWVGKTLSDLRLPDTKGVTIMTLKREGEESTIPRADAVLQKGDVLVIGGPKATLDRIAASAR
jgi:trk system potassium uptake protein TrkA